MNKDEKITTAAETRRTQISWRNCGMSAADRNFYNRHTRPLHCRRNSLVNEPAGRATSFRLIYFGDVSICIVVRLAVQPMYPPTHPPLCWPLVKFITTRNVAIATRSRSASRNNPSRRIRCCKHNCFLTLRFNGLIQNIERRLFPKLYLN